MLRHDVEFFRERKNQTVKLGEIRISRASTSTGRRFPGFVFFGGCHDFLLSLRALSSVG